jgi:hypothetical protein
MGVGGFLNRIKQAIDDVSTLANGQLKDLFSTSSTEDDPKWGKLLSISTTIYPHDSFQAIALRVTYQRKVVSF